jgi:hypothetical protein
MVQKSDKWMTYAVGCLAALLLICGVCVLAGFLGPFKWWTTSGPAAASKTFLNQDPTVKEQLGDIKDFGLFPSGGFNEVNGEGTARLTFSLKGTQGEGKAELGLVKHKGKEWEVVAGKLIVHGQEIILKRGAMPPEAPPEKAPEGPGSSA